MHLMNYKEISELTFKFFNETPENVHSVGYGYKEVNGIITDELSVIFNIIEKKPLSALSQNELLPAFITTDDGTVIKTDVIETPPLSATYCYTPSDTLPPVSLHRATRTPYTGGIQISTFIPNLPGFISLGTLGCVCLDTTDNSLVALTNAHVGVQAPRIASYPGMPNTFSNKQNENYQAIPVNTFSTLKLKRYAPFTTGANRIDAAVLAITDSSQIDTLSSFKQLNLNYNQNLQFANATEIQGLVVNRNPIFKGGRTTGPVGWPGSSPWGSQTCSLTAVQTAWVGSVNFEDYTGTYSIIFFDGILYRGANTIASDAGDSGSAVCALINPDNPSLSAWKIVGLTFAGASPASTGSISVFCRIDAICETLQLTAWNGQTPSYNLLTNESLAYLDGKSDIPSFTANGKTYWQVGVLDP